MLGGVTFRGGGELLHSEGEEGKGGGGGVTFQGGGGGGQGHTHLLVDLVTRPLTTHPFRDGAPFLLLIETPPTFGRSERLFHIPRNTVLLILSPFSLAVSGHHLSPSIAIVF